MKPQTTTRTCGVATALYLASRARGKGDTYRRAGSPALARAEARLHRYAARQGLPWPRVFGTSPWALARLLEQATGSPYRIARWSPRSAAALRRSLAAGLDAAAYVGGIAPPHGDSRTPLLAVRTAFSSLIPRHVVGLVAPSVNADADVIVAEPGSGRDYQLKWEEFLRRASGSSVDPTWGNWRGIIALVLPVDF